MANFRIPGPIRRYDYLARARGPLGYDINSPGSEQQNIPGPLGVKDQRPIRVAEAPKKEAKKLGKKPATPAATQTVHLHFYLPITGNYSATHFYKWLRGPEPSADHPFNRWEEAGITLVLHSNKNSGVADFKRSLQEPGAVVVYLGHSALDVKNKRSLGLTPKGGRAEIPPETLMSLLNKSKAALVILASCASDTCVGKLSGGPAVVVTASGNNLKTWSTEWAHALGAFLFVLLGFEVGASGQPTPRKKGPGTINEALDASAEAFKKTTTDRFKLVNGDGARIIFR